MSRTALVFVGLFGLISAGCSNDLDGTDGQPPPPEDPDADGDTYPESVDCDDTDPDVHPLAPEICDGKDNNCDGHIPEDEFDLDGDGVVECEEVCGDRPLEDTVTTNEDCEYAPESAGEPFEARIEWAMGHEMIDPATGDTIPTYSFVDHPTLTGVFQSPIVAQITDDNYDGDINGQDTPDLAILTGDEFSDNLWSALRVVSGDGSKIHTTTLWDSFTNDNGTHNYAPYLFSGLAAGDTDNDGRTEFAVLVTQETTGNCYLALYEAIQTGTDLAVSLQAVQSSTEFCEAHSPALADVDSDGEVEVIFGAALYRGDDLTLKTSGTGGRGWYNSRIVGADGYWNSGYHSFAWDMDGDGTHMEVVAGSTIYNHDGSTFCELGWYDGSTWVQALDGYPAVADMLRFSGDSVGEPEIVLTGNNYVMVFHGDVQYDPNGQDRCLLVDWLPNKPEDDPDIASSLPSHADCDESRYAFGGQPTVADFNGDGDVEIAVAGSCWYSVYEFASGTGMLQRYAVHPTRDWSSASTGSTVFDFNGDGAAEVVFSDEDAVYVWGVDTRSGLQPWERLVTYLEDDNHKSWTIHEYPLVADVDGDGKAEIVAVNSPRPDYRDQFGFYVLGAADDNWVSARPIWNQHAYYVNNIDDDQLIGYASPNYAPYDTADINSFRQQGPGAFGALAAPNLSIQAEPPCQEGCGDIVVYVQVANTGAYIASGSNVILSLYGVNGTSRTLIDSQALGQTVAAGELTYGYKYELSGWDAYDSLVAVIDDADLSSTDDDWGHSRECDETDNEIAISLDGLCP